MGVVALQAEEMWKIFRALGNETRLKIVRVLLNGCLLYTSDAADE